VAPLCGVALPSGEERRYGGVVCTLRTVVVQAVDNLCSEPAHAIRHAYSDAPALGSPSRLLIWDIHSKGFCANPWLCQGFARVPFSRTITTYFMVGVMLAARHASWPM
jgi:hypothetical protein